MANTTTSPYMGLILPIPGIQTGVQYAIDNNEAFATIDAHSHIPGQGVPVPTQGMNIDADLTFNNFNGIDIRSVRFVNNITPLALPLDQTCIYAVEGDLYYNDDAGNTIQITLGGSVNISSGGSITGMGGTTASVVYTEVNRTFSFYSNTNTPAFLKTGPIKISTNTVSPNTVTLTSSSTLPASYTLTFPESLPAETSLLGTNVTGVETFIPPDNTSVYISGGTLKAYIPTGAITAYAGSVVPAGWLLCTGLELSRTTYSALFDAIGTAYGNGNGINTFNIPDLRGVFLRGVDSVAGRDPDAASRTASAAGGATGNNVGSIQSYQYQSHTHVQDSHNHTQNPHSHAPYFSGGVLGPLPTLLYDVPTQPTIINTTSTIEAQQFTSAQNNAATATNQNSGGNETRPINIYVYYLIKT